VARKQSRVGSNGEEAKWSGKRRKEGLAPRRSGAGDKITGIHKWWPPAAYGTAASPHALSHVHESDWYGRLSGCCG
jgi:hypothetical protein